MEFLCQNTGVRNIIQALPNLTREVLATFQNAHQEWHISPRNTLTMQLTSLIGSTPTQVLTPDANRLNNSS